MEKNGEKYPKNCKSKIYPKIVKHSTSVDSKQWLSFLHYTFIYQYLNMPTSCFLCYYMASCGIPCDILMQTNNWEKKLNNQQNKKPLDNQHK